MTADLILKILPLALTAAVTIFSVCLFLSAKRDFQVCDDRRRRDAESAAGDIAALAKRVGELERDLASFPQTAAPALTSGMNMNKRAHALRLVRQGEGPEHIAAALSLPRKEVELLLKVNRIVTESLTRPTS